jgi:FKBP-type peptidyl-prolyl cis-trans isomerase FkpA
MKKYLWLALVVLAGIIVLVIVSVPGTADGTVVTTESGLKYQDLKVGDGAEAKAGDTVEVNYTGWLTPDGTTKGKEFDSSAKHGKSFTFKLGAHRVIQAWDEGVAGMKVGGHRRLIVPPKLGYGEEGAGEDIPPNATLLFEVELLSVK